MEIRTWDPAELVTGMVLGGITMVVVGYLIFGLAMVVGTGLTLHP